MSCPVGTHTGRPARTGGCLMNEESSQMAIAAMMLMAR